MKIQTSLGKNKYYNYKWYKKGRQKTAPVHAPAKISSRERARITQCKVPTGKTYLLNIQDKYKQNKCRKSRPGCTTMFVLLKNFVRFREDRCYARNPISILQSLVLESDPFFNKLGCRKKQNAMKLIFMYFILVLSLDIYW